MKAAFYLYVLLLSPDDGRLVTSYNEPHSSLDSCRAAGAEFQRKWREEYTDADRNGHQMVTACSHANPKALGFVWENPSPAK